MDIEAYKVAVRLSLTENVTAGLVGLTRHFATAENSAASLRSQLSSIGKMTAVGGGPLAVGGVLTKGLDAALKSAKDLARAQADFKTLNLNTSEMAEVNATAANLSHKVLGSTIAGNIRLIQDLHTAFGDLHHAIDTAPEFTKYETTLKMSLGEHAADGAVNAMAKALEHRGANVLNNPDEFKKELSMATQVTLATRNRVRAEDFLLASQTGGMAYSFLSDRFLYGPFAALMTTMKSGDRAGTMLMTAFSSLIGGHMDKKAKGFYADLGLSEESVSPARLKIMRDAMKGLSAEDRKLYLQSVGGESILSGGLKPEYASMFIHDPDKFAKILASKVRGKYGENLSDEEVSKLISANSNRKTGDLLSALIIYEQKLGKDSRVFRNAMNYESGYNHYLNSPDGAATALSASWINLKAVIGLQLLPTVNKLTLGLAKLFDKMSEFAEKHPTLTKMATYAVAAAAGLTTVAGAVTLLGAAIMAARLVASLGVVSSLATVLGGPLVWAAVAAAGAGYLAYKNWDKISDSVKPEATKMKSEFKEIMAVIGKRIKESGSYFVDGFDSFAAKMQRGWDSLYDYIVGLLNKIPGVSILTSSEKKVGDNAFSLLNDINAITKNGNQGENPVAPNVVGKKQNSAPPTFAESYASAMKQKQSSGMSYADGMKSTAKSLSAPEVSTGNNRPVHVTSNTYLDGKKIAETVTTYQTKQASRAPTGPSGVDPSMNLIHPGMGSLVPR